MALVRLPQISLQLLIYRWMKGLYRPCPNAITLEQTSTIESLGAGIPIALDTGRLM